MSYSGPARSFTWTVQNENDLDIDISMCIPHGPLRKNYIKKDVVKLLLVLSPQATLISYGNDLYLNNDFTIC